LSDGATQEIANIVGIPANILDRVLMDFTNIVLIQIAIFYCLATLLPTSRSNSSLKIAAIVVLTILSMSWYFMPDLMAKLGIGACIVFLVLPMSLRHRLDSLVNSSQYLAASRLAKQLRWLMPTDGMWTYHHLLRGIALAQMGQIETAREIFEKYQPADVPAQKLLMPSGNEQPALSAIKVSRSSPVGVRTQTEIGRSATALLYRSTDRWHEYIAWVEQRLTLEQLSVDRGTTLVYYLRALAETGDLHRCIVEVDKLERNHQINIQQLHLLKMYILAYCGRVDAVTQSCQRLLSMYPAEVHQFWISTAELAADKIEIATRQLAKLRHTSTDSCIQQDIDWRLSQPLPDLNLLNPTDWEVVAQIEATVRQEAQYGSQIPANAWTPVTTFLIAINAIVFFTELVWQYKSGNQNLSFITWGGLFAPLVMSGQWWRILTANFLHMGILHLGMNMLALLYLGKFVEYRLGSFRYLLAYATAGIGSMAIIAYIDTKWMTQPHVTVGASGAIMGLLGTMGAIHLSGWRQAKAISAARQFQAVLFSVGFQLVFDLTNGHTSIVGHFSGLMLGFLIGLGLVVFGVRD
jgi:rhomboid protease GluP